MGEISKTNKKPQATIKSLLQGDAFRDAVQQVLPSHVTSDRMVRVAINAMNRVPELANCDHASFFSAMMTLSQYGLEPDGRLAHLIPFKNNKKGIVECQLIIDYKGLVELAYRSGYVSNIHADVVRDGDIFEFNLGRISRHVPHFLRNDADKPKEAGKVLAAYALVELKAGPVKTEVMSRDEIEGVRRRSKAGSSGPWVTDWNEMAKKTVFRRCSKWIPLSAEIREAFHNDDDTRPPIRKVATTTLVLDGPPQDDEDGSDTEGDGATEGFSYSQALSEAVTADELNAIGERLSADPSIDDGDRIAWQEEIDEKLAIIAERG